MHWLCASCVQVLPIAYELAGSCAQLAAAGLPSTCIQQLFQVVCFVALHGAEYVSYGQLPLFVFDWDQEE